MPDLRRCYGCGRSLPAIGFSPDPSKGSGRKSICRACDREKARAHYRAHSDARRVKARERAAARRAQERRSTEVSERNSNPKGSQ